MGVASIEFIPPQDGHLTAEENLMEDPSFGIVNDAFDKESSSEFDSTETETDENTAVSLDIL